MELKERQVDFSYGYRMRCECGGSVLIDAAKYLAEIQNEALVDCEHCGESIWIGPAVAALRDDNDPALDNEMVLRFAWYHTSTWADWPSPHYRVTVEQRFSGPIIERHLFDVPAAIERFATQALHLGTYEAAIENMLRRMNDQADRGSQFFLYRVRLKVDPGRIEPGYRDESNEEASQLTVDDIPDGVDVVRYLNVHEALGSLSLAIRPEAIDEIQQLAIPIEQTGDLPEGLVARINGWELERQSIVAEAAALPTLRTGEVALMRAGVRPDPDGIGARSHEVDERSHSLWSAVDDELRWQFLADVSPVVADEVSNAIGSRGSTRNSGIAGYVSRFAALASLLTSPDDLLQRLSRIPWVKPGVS